MSITPEELQALPVEELKRIYMEQYEKLFKLGSKLVAALKAQFPQAKIDLVADPEYRNLYVSAPWFIFAIIDEKTNEDDKMTLLLEVTCTALSAGLATKIITQFIRPDSWKFGETYYYDNKSKEVKYGEEAKVQHLVNHMESKGMVKCPSCERFFSPDSINTDGICIICEDEIENATWM